MGVMVRVVFRKSLQALAGGREKTRGLLLWICCFGRWEGQSQMCHTWTDVPLEGSTCTGHYDLYLIYEHYF